VTAALDHFLPSSIIDCLRASSDPKAVLETFDGEAETPALVWNGAMRKTLRKFVAGQLEAYRKGGEPDGHPWILTHEIQVLGEGAESCASFKTGKDDDDENERKDQEVDNA